MSTVLINIDNCVTYLLTIDINCLNMTNTIINKFGFFFLFYDFNTNIYYIDFY